MLPRYSLRLAKMARSATYAFNFLPSPVMPNYCLLLGCAATLSFTVAIAAQPTPATKPAIPARPIEAAPKAVPANVQKEAAAKTPAPPKEPAITFNSVHVDGPYIAMTFDDGPSATLTPKLLDILAAHHIKVTFFVLGEMVAEHPEILARAAREGHKIASHSWSHPISRRCRRKVFAASYSGPTMKLKAPLGNVPLISAAIWIDYRTQKKMDPRPIRI